MASHRDRPGHVQFFITDEEVRNRMARVLARIPYRLSIAGLAERGIVLALDELERAFPEATK